MKVSDTGSNLPEGIDFHKIADIPCRKAPKIRNLGREFFRLPLTTTLFAKLATIKVKILKALAFQ